MVPEPSPGREAVDVPRGSVPSAQGPMLRDPEACRPVRCYPPHDHRAMPARLYRSSIQRCEDEQACRRPSPCQAECASRRGPCRLRPASYQCVGRKERPYRHPRRFVSVCLHPDARSPDRLSTSGDRPGPYDRPALRLEPY